MKNVAFKILILLLKFGLEFKCVFKEGEMLTKNCEEASLIFKTENYKQNGYQMRPKISEFHPSATHPHPTRKKKDAFK